MAWYDPEDDENDSWRRFLQPPPPPPPAKIPSYTGSEDTGGLDPMAGLKWGGGFDYSTPDYPGKLGYDIPGAPVFDAPDFVPPDYESVKNDPAFKFRLETGGDALEASAAARGVVRTGGTLKDILGYGQSLASQEYENAFNRAVKQHEFAYGEARDAFAPILAAWQARVQQNSDAARWAWEDFWRRQDDEFRREQMVFGA